MDALAQIENAADRYGEAELWLDTMELRRAVGLAIPDMDAEETPREKAMLDMRHQMEQFGEGLRRLLSPSHPKAYANSEERAEAEHASERLKRIVTWLAENGTVCDFAGVASRSDKLAWAEPTDLENLNDMQTHLQRGVENFLALGTKNALLVLDPNQSDDKESVRGSAGILALEAAVAAFFVEIRLRGESIHDYDIEEVRAMFAATQKKSNEVGLVCFDMSLFTFYMFKGYEPTKSGRPHPRSGDNFLVATWNGDLMTAPETARKVINARCKGALGFNMDGSALVY